MSIYLNINVYSCSTDDHTSALLPIDPLTDIAANETLNDADPDE